MHRKNAVHIDLDDIVVLVGPNNAGKSSILRAYELVMSEGSNEGLIKLDDFPNNNIDPDNLPEIELHTIVYEERVGKHKEKVETIKSLLDALIDHEKPLPENCIEWENINQLLEEVHKKRD